MSEHSVYISYVLERYRQSGMSSHSENFSLVYMYTDKNGNVQRRTFETCRRKTGSNGKENKPRALKGITHENREAGKVHIEWWDGKRWLDRRLFIFGLTHYNGFRIDHRF